MTTPNPKNLPEALDRTPSHHFSSATRSFFLECRNSLKEVRLPSTISDDLGAMLVRPPEGASNSKALKGRFDCGVAQLELVEAMAQWPMCQVPRTKPTTRGAADRIKSLEEIAKAHNLPMGFLLDLVEELHPEAPEPILIDGVCCGKLRSAACSVSMFVLLVPKDPSKGNGIVARLTVDLMENGHGALYPIPAFALVYRDSDWIEAEKNVCSCLQEYLRVWPPDWDIRWRLTMPIADGKFPEGFPGLEGNSSSAALALVVLWLLVQHAHRLGRLNMPKERQALVDSLLALEQGELEEIACSARIADAKGRLDVVGAIDKKFDEQLNLMGLRGEVRSVVLHSDQREEFLKKYEVPGARPLLVLKAGTLEGAIHRLVEESAPRRAMRQHELQQCRHLDVLGWKTVSLVPDSKEAAVPSLFRVLPLLREVKRKQLPKEESHQREDPDDASEEDAGIKGMDLVGWEEEMRAQEVTYELVALEKLFDDFRAVVEKASNSVPRFVVLGPPGSGKTTLVQYLAWQSASGALRLNGRRLLPARVKLRGWEVWLAEFKEPSLPEYLAHVYKDFKGAPTAEQWRIWLQRGEVLLLLDGLDEVDGRSEFSSALASAVKSFRFCTTVLTCRTVSFEQHRALCLEFPVFTLAGFDTKQRNAFIRAFPADHPGKFDADKLMKQLDQNPQMAPLASNPLLLAIICFVVDDPKGVALPARRSELYDHAVDRLLARTRRVEIAWPQGRPWPLARTRRVLSRVALRLFLALDHRRKLTFSQEQLLAELTWAAQQEDGYEIACGPYVDALLADVVQNSGLLRGTPSEGYHFLHLTFQEFLAADALAEMIEPPKGKTRWKRKMDFGVAVCTPCQVVDAKAWDSRYHELIALLAGRLANPLPVLKLLSNTRRDDIHRHRLALGVYCVLETTCGVMYRTGLSAEISAPWEQEVDLLVVKACDWYCNHRGWDYRRGEDIARRPLPPVAYPPSRSYHFDLRLPALANRPAATSRLIHWSRDVDDEVRGNAAFALGQLGETAATPAVLGRLLELTRDAYKYPRTNAAIALGQMGKSAATPEVLARQARHPISSVLDRTSGDGRPRRPAGKFRLATLLKKVRLEKIPETHQGQGGRRRECLTGALEGVAFLSLQRKRTVFERR